MATLRGAAQALNQAKRIVVKIGSTLLVNDAGEVKQDWLTSLAEDINNLMQQEKEIILVSSGAIAVGRGPLGLKAKGLQLDEKQAAAAVGQILLAHAYQNAMSKHERLIAQILLTLSDTEDRRKHLNARNTLTRLLTLRALPLINENDTVATSEIRYGDNDRLAARVATMVGADLLLLLSDIDGLYDANPNDFPKANYITHVPVVTPGIEAMAQTSSSDYGSGGMITKIVAAKIATNAGTTMIIAKGTCPHPLKAIEQGHRATLFEAQTTPMDARKTWIASSLSPQGKLHIDKGAEEALLKGSSLLPVGIIAIHGNFRIGDTLSVINNKNQEIARGLSAYDTHEALQIIGKKSSEIANILGYKRRPALVHRDNLVLMNSNYLKSETI